MKQLRNSVVVLAMAAFAAACADSSTAPGRTLLDGGVARQIIDSVQTYPFPTIAAGAVELCKISNVPGTFDFTVSVNGGQAQNVSISLPGTPCTTVYTSTLPNLSGSDVVVITENALSSGWATTINTTRFLGPNVVYAPTSLSDLEEPLLRRVTVRANVDMSRRVRFTNTFTSTPPDPICDFITFGRLVWESGDQKVVVSGNAGGFNNNGTIKGEFHVEVNGVDNHVADIDTYGPITSGPLSGASFPNSRMVTGTAKNGVAVELRLWDGGEPGKDTDWIYVKLGASSEPLGAAGQTIDQGNMQYHPHCRGPVPSTTSSAAGGKKKG